MDPNQNQSQQSYTSMPPQSYTTPSQYTDSYPGKGMCIASLVLGICSLVIPYAGLATAIVGLVLGIMGKKKAIEVGAPTGMATAGIVCSIVSLALGVLWIVVCTACVGVIGAAASDIDPSWFTGW